MSASELPSVWVWLAHDGWRWQFRSPNGKPQAESAQGYTRRGDCLSALESVRRGIGAAELVIGKGPAKAPPIPTFHSLAR